MDPEIHISPEAKAWMSELAVELRSFYQRFGRNLTQHELMMEIERNYGDEIMRRVCIPHNLVQGVCLLIAVEVAKNGVE